MNIINFLNTSTYYGIENFANFEAKKKQLIDYVNSNISVQESFKNEIIQLSLKFPGKFIQLEKMYPELFNKYMPHDLKEHLYSEQKLHDEFYKIFSFEGKLNTFKLDCIGIAIRYNKETAENFSDLLKIFKLMNNTNHLFDYVDDYYTFYFGFAFKNQKIVNFNKLII